VEHFLKDEAAMNASRMDPLNEISQRETSVVSFEASTVVSMKNAIYWDVTPCGSCKNRRFRETCSLHNFLVNDKVVHTSRIHFTVMIEATRYSETLVLTSATRCHITEDGIPHSHRSENLKSYIALKGWAMER
jgi:hypothetical protein